MLDILVFSSLYCVTLPFAIEYELKMSNDIILGFGLVEITIKKHIHILKIDYPVKRIFSHFQTNANALQYSFFYRLSNSSYLK